MKEETRDFAHDKDAKIKRNSKGQFAKGVSGNPMGRGGDKHRELIQFFKEKSMEAAELLYHTMITTKSDKMRLLCIEMMHDRAFGKPTQTTVTKEEESLEDFIKPIIIKVAQEAKDNDQS